MDPRGRIFGATSGLVTCLDGVADVELCRTADDEAELSVDVLESVLADRVGFLTTDEAVVVLPPRWDC